MRATKIVVVTLLAGLGLAAACGAERKENQEDDDASSSDGGSSTATTNGPGGSSTAQGGQAPGGPQITSLTVDPPLFDPWGSSNDVTFVAEVSDPDGSADIALGTLEGSTGTPYGEFLKSGGGNTFALTLAGEEDLLLEPIEFASGSIMRTFIARFTDQAGHEGTASVQLELTCSDGMYGWCGMEWCVNTDTDGAHCGQCGNLCSGTTPYCQNGQCTSSP